MTEARPGTRRWPVAVLIVAVVGLAVAAVVIGLVVLLGGDGDEAAEGGRVPLEGFGEVAVVVESAEGEEVDYCLLLAETPEQRQRGLMEVTDPELGGYDGMLFRFDAEVETGFWMMNTPMPLTVAYVGADGELVSSADMEPCVGDDIAEGCPSYPPDGPYRWAVEVPQGGLDDIGLVDGARFTDTREPCPG